MKLEKLVGDRFKERPADCVIDSHALMGHGLIRHEVLLHHGIWSESDKS